jgi:hypothetical protein
MVGQAIRERVRQRLRPPERSGVDDRDEEQEQCRDAHGGTVRAAAREDPNDDGQRGHDAGSPRMRTRIKTNRRREGDGDP